MARRAGLVRRWRAQSPARRRLLVRALVAVVAVRATLWLLPYRPWRRLITALSDLARRSPVAGIGAADVAWAVHHASRIVPRATCLTQAVAAAILLRRAGGEGRLRFGVRRTAVGDLAAHAWLETEEGILIGNTGLGDYHPLRSSSAVDLAPPPIAIPRQFPTPWSGS